MKILYFAWIRERVGKSQEDINLPDHIDTVAQFLTWMESRGEEYAFAFENESAVRIALDREHCTDFTNSIANVTEIALFPPMTGG